MNYKIALIVGLALFVLGAQDIIRLFLDSQNQSIFFWLPVSTTVQVIISSLITIGGALLANWAVRKL